MEVVHSSMEGVQYLMWEEVQRLMSEGAPYLGDQKEEHQGRVVLEVCCKDQAVLVAGRTVEGDLVELWAHSEFLANLVKNSEVAGCSCLDCD